jgi:hypothetical protein
VAASIFASSTGGEIQPAFRFEPETIKLAPREQMLVRMSVQISKRFRPNVAYRGEVTIPDLPGTRVPVVLRRCLPPSVSSTGRSARKVRRDSSLAKKRRIKNSV